jgi:hypothetical protein
VVGVLEFLSVQQFEARFTPSCLACSLFSVRGITAPRLSYRKCGTCTFKFASLSPSWRPSQKAAALLGKITGDLNFFPTPVPVG